MTSPHEGEPRFSPVEAGFGYHVDFREQTADQLTSYITETLLPLENKQYTGGNTAEHKLLFLTGGTTFNVSSAHTSDGSPVYTTRPDHPKAPEILEFMTAISDHFEREENMAHVLSEAADIFFNVTTLRVLDPERAETYRKWVGILHTSLGITRRDALLLATTKYKRRLTMGKDVDAEERLIGMLIEPNPATGDTGIRVPTAQNLDQSYDIAGHLRGVLMDRLNEIRNTPPFIEPEEEIDTQGRLIN